MPRLWKMEKHDSASRVGPILGRISPGRDEIDLCLFEASRETRSGRFITRAATKPLRQPALSCAIF
jgi:hypothetical protein